ncbi:MAG: threonine synthase [Acidobacteriota bacterium]
MHDSHLDRLECPRCHATRPAVVRQQLCACGGPLFARYRLADVAAVVRTDDLARRTPDLWRYRELLPVQDPAFARSLGEGFTPLLASRRLGAELGLPGVWFKDESGNPTGSFKARGLSVAIARAAELGARTVVLPTAGNAGGALACYAALHGLRARVYLPASASRVFRDEAVAFGAEVVQVDGSIAACARRLASEMAPDWFDISTLKEPYRLEGKKTMGFELWEQLGTLPDAILYPTGGGTGLIGMWKAFAELAELGWNTGKRPRMIAVQSAGCAPVVDAFRAGRDTVEPCASAVTAAEGLRVPRPLADREILAAIRESGGTAIAVAEERIATGVLRLARTEGILTSPEGGALVAALEDLTAAGDLRPGASVVLFLTGSAYKYPSFLETLDRPL